jgi:hypothetical protein
MNQLASKVVDWTISRLPGKAQTLLTRYGLFAVACLGLRRVPVVLLRGATNQSGQHGTMLVAGHDPWVSYLPSRFFVGEPQRELVGNVSAWELPALLNRLRTSADLTIARMDQLSARIWFGHDYLAVPEWVGTKLSVPDDLDKLMRSGGSLRRDMTLIRRHKFLPLVTRGSEDFEKFYRSMYVPFTRTRHGELVFMRKPHDLRRRLGRGGILWMLRDGQRVAGMQFERKCQTLDLLALGTVNGDLGLVRDGAIAALYYHVIRLARELECTMVDFRGSRPSLSGGLLRFKRKWGTTLYDKTDTYYDLLVRWNGLNAVVKDFLSHTGLIFRDEGRLSAIHAGESQSPRSLWVGGLHRLYLLTESGRQPMMDEGASLSIAGAGPDSEQAYQGAR